MKEKDFQTRFNKWCKYNVTESSAFELKLIPPHRKSLPWSSLQEHQLNSLLQAKHHSVIYKIPDAGFQNPFDSLVLNQCKAYVVVMFYRLGQHEFFLIDIDTWVNEEATSKRKSLTEERAREIGLSCFF